MLDDRIISGIIRRDKNYFWIRIVDIVRFTRLEIIPSRKTAKMVVAR